MKDNKETNNLLKPYENQWVALSPDRKRVLSSGHTLKNVTGQLDKRKRKEAIFLRVLPSDVYYVPLSL